MESIPHNEHHFNRNIEIKIAWICPETIIKVISFIETQRERWESLEARPEIEQGQPVMEGFGGHAKELEIYPEHSGKYCDIIRFVLGRESRMIVGDRFEEE